MPATHVPSSNLACSDDSKSQGFCVERIIADVHKQEAIRHSLCA